MALERELETFARELPTLLQQQENHGKYALIRAEAVDSIWATKEEALAAGYDRFGLETFLVKEVVEHEKPVYFSRRVDRWQ